MYFSQFLTTCPHYNQFHQECCSDCDRMNQSQSNTLPDDTVLFFADADSVPAHELQIAFVRTCACVTMAMRVTMCISDSLCFTPCVCARVRR